MRTPDKEKCRGILEHPRTDSERGGDDKVIEAWNAMILEKRKEQSHEDV